MSAATSTSSGSIAFSFVVGNNPEQLKGHRNRQVRSHVSKVGWRLYAKAKDPAAEHRRTKRYKAKENEKSDVYELAAHDVLSPTSQSPPGDWQLGGGRFDPFCAYPGPRNPKIPALVDHYIVHMAVDIPELDQPGNHGLLRSSWFPLVISDQATFHTILLLSAANALSVKPDMYPRNELLKLKSDAIGSINSSLQSEKNWASDALIGATAKMASFEAMYGQVESYHMHMAGLCKMLELRGGLSALGLGGLLRRIVVWIDLNSAFLLKSPRYFPQHCFEGEVEITDPNPQGFLAP